MYKRQVKVHRLNGSMLLKTIRIRELLKESHTDVLLNYCLLYTSLNIQFNNDSPIFLFYGFIKPYKGLDLLKRACEILNNRKVDFNLIEMCIRDRLRTIIKL